LRGKPGSANSRSSDSKFYPDSGANSDDRPCFNTNADGYPHPNYDTCAADTIPGAYSDLCAVNFYAGSDDDAYPQTDPGTHVNPNADFSDV
jgi:hypothetical protein